MSAAAVAHAWLARVPPEAKLVLLALAEGESLGRVADLTGMRMAHVLALLGLLSDLGYVTGDREVGWEVALPIEPPPPPPPTYRKVPIPAELRRAVFERDGFRCKHCDEPDPNLLTCDHIIAESLGGPATLENLRTLCRSCNSRKGTRDHVPPRKGAPSMGPTFYLRDGRTLPMSQEDMERHVESGGRWMPEEDEEKP